MDTMMKKLLFGLLALSASLSADEKPVDSNANHAKQKVLAFAGSTRKDSCNKKLINNAAEIGQDIGLDVTVVDLKDFPMPLFDADLEQNEGMPENAKRLRKMMVASDKIIISSPEYNGSLPAVLKNAIDWLSRSEDGKPSREAFAGKKFAIMSCSPGAAGGAMGLDHLRAVLKRIGGQIVTLQVVVPNAYEAFNKQGKIEQASIRQEIKQELQELANPAML
jgi:chromate reductase